MKVKDAVLARSLRDWARFVLSASVEAKLPGRTELEILIHRMRPSVRKERAIIRANWKLPKDLPRAKKSRGEVWGITVVHNEEDTIGYNLERLARQGIDGFIVADNNSTDGTREILKSSKRDLRVFIIEDGLNDWLEASKRTLLGDLARKAGAEWIVPFDADELWFSENTTIADYLRQVDASVVTADIHDVLPSLDDDFSEPDPFLRIRRINSSPHNKKKVAYRACRFAELAPGAHRVKARGSICAGLFVAHYPWRSLTQLRNKVRQRGIAVQSPGVPPTTAVHWRAMAQWSDDEIDRAWESICGGRPIPEMYWTPSRDCNVVAAGTWRHWELPRYQSRDVD